MEKKNTLPKKYKTLNKKNVSFIIKNMKNNYQDIMEKILSGKYEIEKKKKIS
jgi:hypothetical protein